MTYVLNTRSLKGRLFVETADGGLMMNNPLHFAPGQYPLGTMDSERPFIPRLSFALPILCLLDKSLLGRLVPHHPAAQ